MVLKNSVPKAYHKYLLIGITGHRNLLSGDKEKLVESLKAVFREIYKDTRKKPIAVISSLADGADQLAIKVALEMGIPVVPLLVVKYQDLDRLLAKQLSLEDLIAFENEFYSFWKDNREKLLKPLVSKDATKRIISILNTTDTHKKRAKGFEAARQVMYSYTAEFLAKSCDYIIALWDGVDTGLPSGTSDIVHMALEGCDNRGKEIKFNRNKSKVHSEEVLTNLKARGQRPLGKLYQVVTPRDSNPFPLGRKEIIAINDTSFYTRTRELLSPPSKFQWRYTYFPHTEVKTRTQVLNKWLRAKLLHSEIFWRFVFPASLALLTVFLGVWGFREYEKQKWHSTPINKLVNSTNTVQWDSLRKDTTKLRQELLEEWDTYYPEGSYSNCFFKATSLLTSNSSVYESRFNVPVVLWIARFKVLPLYSARLG